MVAQANVVGHVRASANTDRLAIDGERFPAFICNLEVAFSVECFDVEVLHIAVEGSEPPRNMFVVSGDYEGHSGKRARLRRGACKSAMYQMLGSVKLRCMSFESKGFPLAVCVPAMTQLLEPGTQSRHERSFRVDDAARWSRMAVFHPCRKMRALDGAPSAVTTPAAGRARFWSVRRPRCQGWRAAEDAAC